MAKDISDQVLLLRIQEGDKQAFEYLFYRYWERVHTVVYNRLQDPEVADDMVQEVFTDLWQRRNKLHIHTSLKSFLYQAVKHGVYKHIRSQSVRTREEYIYRICQEYYEQNFSPNPEESIEYEELKSQLEDRIQALPGKTQEIFELSRQQGYTYQQIADKLNCSPKTLEYWFGVEVIFKDEVLKQETFVYHFDNDLSLKSTLKTLTKMADFTYRIQNQTVIIEPLTTGKSTRK